MKTILTCTIVLICLFSRAQQNLVPNPSFEEYDTCPNNISQVFRANGWSSYGQTPEYFNACDTFHVGVPENSFGFQHASNGNAYCGIYSHGTIPDYREFIGSKLLSPLIIGNKYFASLKVSLADNANCATNNLGILFSNIQFSDTGAIPLNNHAFVSSIPVISDTLDWTIISGSFVADSAYQYIIVGNFFTDNSTDSVLFYLNLCSSYYYIDDVCVSTDSLLCEQTFTSIKENKTTEVKIYPNPITHTLHIEMQNTPHTIQSIGMYDVAGKEVHSQQTTDNSKIVSIDVSAVSNGLYFLHIEMSNGERIIKKVLKE